jgi:hypothetical protein
MSLPPSEIPQGAIRFNTDSQKLEFYAQGEWWNIVTDTPNLGTSSDTTAGARGVFGAGAISGVLGYNTIDYINISSTGNASDFGDLTLARRNLAAFSSSVRGCWAGGLSGSSGPITDNVIDYVTISSTGNALDFGDLIQPARGQTGFSNSTRGIWCGGVSDTSPNVYYNNIEYVTISATGNSNDFGDLSIGKNNTGCCSSSTRGIIAGGYTGNFQNTIEFVTISTLGNAADFGDLTLARRALSASSNSVRGIFAGGVNPSYTNLIDYISINSLGNAINFGSLTSQRQSFSSCSSSTRSIFAGGYTDPSTASNIIDYITILTQGNAVDFGDLTLTRNQSAGCSNAHGGL